MSTTPARRPYSAGRILLIVFGALALLVSLGLLGGGSGLLWADRTQRDSAGYLNTDSERVDSGAYAVVARDLMVEVPGWMTGADRLGSVRVSVSPSQGDRAIFLGIAPRSSVDAYLGGVSRDELTRWHTSPATTQLTHRDGGTPAAPPGTQTIWVASSSGTGTQTVTWQVEGGSWAVVAMNPDGSPGLVFNARAAATAPFILPLGIGLVVGGFLLGLIGLLMVLLGAQRAAGYTPAPSGQSGTPAGPPPGWAPPPPPSAASPGWAPAAAPPPPPPPPGYATVGYGWSGPPRFTVYPVAIEGHLDEPLNRWLWLVKWFLAIPHYIVLALLSIPFILLTLAAAVAILFTGVYPRTIFEFNLGVMRWWWRVAFYSYGALGTDRYPPFSLGAEPEYPARLDVAYPERLSRGLVLVKSWLLAIPHLVIVGIFAGGFSLWHVWGGVIGVLALVAGIILLVEARYSRTLFDVLMALNRWVFRVAAYVALMRDEYPPFRLDMGELEPEVAGTSPAAPPMAPRPLGT